MRFEGRLRKLETADWTRSTRLEVRWDDEAIDEPPWSRCPLARHSWACRVGRNGRHVITLAWE